MIEDGSIILISAIVTVLLLYTVLLLDSINNKLKSYTKSEEEE
jgi:hypothetical protein